VITLNEYDDIVAMYVEVFKEPPVITGGSLWQSSVLIERLLDAIDTGVPFVDTPVLEGTST
jgi:hypothetical protein